MPPCWPRWNDQGAGQGGGSRIDGAAGKRSRNLCLIRIGKKPYESVSSKRATMASGKELRTKIKSVENTKKITKAMEMISVSKMRKAQERMRRAPFSEKVRSIAANSGEANPNTMHAFMKTNDKAVGMIVVSTDKGLCGGLNTNLFRAVTGKLREAQSAGKSAVTVAIGKGRVSEPHWRQGGLAGYPSGRQTHLEKLIGPVKVLLDAHVKGEVSAVYLCYNKFISTMKQEPVVEQLPPLSAERCRKTKAAGASTAGTISMSPMQSDGHRRVAGALRRSPGVPGGGRKHGIRNTLRGWLP